MSKIFISYSHVDRAYAEQLRNALAEVEVHRTVEFAAESTTEITTERYISTKLREAIQKADAVVLLLSKDALASSWVMFEAGVAQGLGKRILPLILSEVDPDKLDFIERDRALDVSKMSPMETAKQIQRAMKLKNH